MKRTTLTLLFVALWLGFAPALYSEEPSLRVVQPGLTEAWAREQSDGCVSCHIDTDAKTMHRNPGVVIGCADCHGGNPEISGAGLHPESSEYHAALNRAHVLPEHPEKFTGSGNPVRPYTDTLKEPLDFIRFINPGDLRVAPETCGGCHSKEVYAVQRSLMTTAAMFWGGATYNNNILPFKNYILGETYARDGSAQTLLDPDVSEERKKMGALDKVLPIPAWEVVEPGDNFRVFERGGKFIKSQFAEVGLPESREEPGKPDVLASNRGLGTGGRISVPVLNTQKTRLNDPHLSLFGTNDHPGDFRSSGCTACHVIYANDRDPVHSGPYASYGHDGKTKTVDPTIPTNEEGHPIRHEFTRAIPSSQCMVCHMHQPNMFVNSFYGFTMWDYESDASFMWPEEQKFPTNEETYKSLAANPEGAAIRGKWSDETFLRALWENNDKLKNTQFADYHGHGWNFRAVFKKDRKGNLLDEEGNIVEPNDPDKFKKAVHLMDIHLEKGMHCVDCHFSRDSHGDGHMYGEVAQAVEITCRDCHGSVKEKTNLLTTGPAAPEGGTDLALQRNSFGKSRFQWRNGQLYQRSNLYPDREWHVPQVRDIIDPKSSQFNPKASRAKTVLEFEKREGGDAWGDLKKIDAAEDMSSLLAHANEEMACFTCHSSWVTSCAGCHLPIEANFKSETKHYEGKETRNWASYNPQVARDQMFQIGKHGPAKGNKIVPVRSSSALVLSSTDVNRQKIYVQQPPSAASGHSGQAFAPHYPHTVRTTETKQCDDCHISEANDNNAIMAQLLLFGTNFVNFMGYNAYVATGTHGLEAVQVTEFEEPQAVIGSYLHRYAYPEWYQQHLKRDRELQIAHQHHGVGGSTNTVQLRGEYLYTTAGEGGFRVYDVANVANKGFSERIVTGPFSPLGHDTHVPSENATHFVLPTNMAIAPFRKQLPENQETPMHAIYHYAVITDSVEGLIIVNVDTMADRDRTNNFLERDLTWNENNILSGARHVTLAGTNAYIAADRGIVVVDLDDPLEPRVRTVIPLTGITATEIQFRYLFAAGEQGFHVIDVTNPDFPRIVEKAFVPLANAGRMYVARTFAYVAAGKNGLAIIDIERPEQPELYQLFNDGGTLNDVRDVKVATTNASLFAYVADGENGLKIYQLTDPERVPTYYGFSPDVKPLLVSRYRTHGPAVAISKGLDRDRAVDESGHQVSVFGRIGSRPLNLEEMQRLYLDSDGNLFKVSSDTSSRKR